jgi:hypothetical protein
VAEKVGGHRPRAQATKASIARRRTRRRLRFARNDGDGSYSNLQTASGMHVHVLAARCVRVSRLVSPSSKRAQGKPGARCTRGLVCKVHKRKRTRATGSAEAIRPSLRSGFTAYFALSPVTGFLATVTSPGLILRNLAPAPGRQDHTTSPSAISAFRQARLRVHRIPPRVGDVAQRPSHRVRRAD